METTKRLMTRSDCYACNKVPEQLTDGHVVARSRGGSDGPENWVPSCRRCNSSKGKRNLIEWTAVKGGNLNTLDLDVLVIYVRNMFKLLEAEVSLDTPDSGPVRFLLGCLRRLSPPRVTQMPSTPSGQLRCCKENLYPSGSNNSLKPSR